MEMQKIKRGVRVKMEIKMLKKKIIENLKDIFKSSDYFTYLFVLLITKIIKHFNIYTYFIFLNNKHNENNSYFS